MTLLALVALALGGLCITLLVGALVIELADEWRRRRRYKPRYTGFRNSGLKIEKREGRWR